MKNRSLPTTGSLSLGQLAIWFLVLSSAVSAQDGRTVAKIVLPSVVMISTYDSGGRPVGLGSGFFVKSDVVATNLHVLEGAADADIKLVGSSSAYPIIGVIALDRRRDLVLLQVRGIVGIALALGTIGQPEVGEEIYAVGNPQGLEGSISSGIISSSGIRRIEGEDLLQITAPISPGSSGGPVVNKQGEVIGVAESSLRNGQNLNFAVPVAYLELLLKNTSAAIPIASLSAKASKEKPLKSEADKCGDTPYKLSPSSRAEEYKFAGYEFYRAGVYDQAKEAFKRAIRLNRKDGDAYFQLAKIYSNLRCSEEAVLANRQAIILKPKEPEYSYSSGSQVRALSRYDEAIEVYQEGLKIKPNYSDFYQGLGAAFIDKVSALMRKRRNMNSAG